MSKWKPILTDLLLGNEHYCGGPVPEPEETTQSVQTKGQQREHPKHSISLWFDK